jgi:Rieske Fe-S protein
MGGWEQSAGVRGLARMGFVRLCWHMGCMATHEHMFVNSCKLSFFKAAFCVNVGRSCMCHGGSYELQQRMAF